MYFVKLLYYIDKMIKFLIRYFNFYFILIIIYIRFFLLNIKLLAK